MLPQFLIANHLIASLPSELPPGTGVEAARGILQRKGLQPYFSERDNMLLAIREVNPGLFGVRQIQVKIHLDESESVRLVEVRRVNFRSSSLYVRPKNLR